MEREDVFVLLRRWQSFLELSGRANPTTRRQYVRYLLGFSTATLIDPRDVTENDLLDYFSDEKVGANMRGMTLRALKSFYRWWLPPEEAAKDPTRRFPVPRRKYGPAPSLDVPEIEQLLEAAKKVDPRAPWTLQLALVTGARLGSLVEVMPADVDFDRRWIDFRIVKNDEPYGVPLEAEGIEACQELLNLIEYMPRTVKRRRPTLVGVGSGSVWAWTKRAGDLAGVKTWPHLLRHTFASQAASNPDVDIRTWIELMNHRDGSLLRRYAAKSDPRLRSAVGGIQLRAPRGAAE